MTVQAGTTEAAFHPRTIAQARTVRSRHAGGVVRRLILSARERLVEARRRRRDLAMLLEMDNRLLADIGLTRDEVRVAARTPWWGTPVALAEAASRREEAMAEVRRQAALRMVRARPITPDAGDIVPQERAAA
ncbi:MAG: DUF1127 domain-containing protein [Pseudorhodoplanes sp.]|nr:DUF1127 domain-containing protein [Pseudorhodoplanes sp.]